MPKFCVKLRRTPKVIEIDAATFEEEADVDNPIGPGDRVAKDGHGKVIAYFSGKDIAAWWTEGTVKDITIRFEKPTSEEQKS